MAEFENSFEELSVGFFFIAILFMLFSFLMDSEVIAATFLTFILLVPIFQARSSLISAKDTEYVSNSLNDRIQLSGFILIAATWYGVYSTTDISRGITFVVYLSFYTYTIDSLIIIFEPSLDTSQLTIRKVQFGRYLLLLITAFFSSRYPVAQVFLPAVLLLFALATYPIISFVRSTTHHIKSNI